MEKYVKIGESYWNTKNIKALYINIEQEENNWHRMTLLMKDNTMIDTKVELIKAILK